MVENQNKIALGDNLPEINPTVRINPKIPI